MAKKTARGACASLFTFAPLLGGCGGGPETDILLGLAISAGGVVAYRLLTRGCDREQAAGGAAAGEGPTWAAWSPGGGDSGGGYDGGGGCDGGGGGCDGGG